MSDLLIPLEWQYRNDAARQARTNQLRDNSDMRYEARRAETRQQTNIDRARQDQLNQNETARQDNQAQIGFGNLMATQQESRLRDGQLATDRYNTGRLDLEKQRLELDREKKLTQLDAFRATGNLYAKTLPGLSKELMALDASEKALLKEADALQVNANRMMAKGMIVQDKQGNYIAHVISGTTETPEVTAMRSKNAATLNANMGALMDRHSDIVEAKNAKALEFKRTSDYMQRDGFTFGGPNLEVIHDKTGMTFNEKGQVTHPLLEMLASPKVAAIKGVADFMSRGMGSTHNPVDAVKTIADTARVPKAPMSVLEKQEAQGAVPPNDAAESLNYNGNKYLVPKSLLPKIVELRDRAVAARVKQGGVNAPGIVQELKDAETQRILNSMLADGLIRKQAPAQAPAPAQGGVVNDPNFGGFF